jgi:signal peptidase I
MAAPADAKAPPRDHVRETLETLVFVVVLVLILQLFVLEAFVIPTGSMAETQLGYHKNVVCQQCRYEFPVNCSDEVERPSHDTYVAGYTCPNCQHAGMIDWAGRRVAPTSGDRVLVHKAMSPDDRGRVVVFKFPVAPQRKQQAQNYIKRCVGFGGETVAISYGDLYVTKALKYTDHPQPDDPRDEWQEGYTYPRDPLALKLFADGKEKGFPAGVDGFELVRKPDELAMEMRRIVYDNDHQPADLIDKCPPRWNTRAGEGAGWAADNPKAPKVFTHQGDSLGWIGYRHLSKVRDPEGNTNPQKITNGMGYNGGLGYNDEFRPHLLRPLKPAGGAEDYWVGDLMLECTAKVETGSEVTMELSRGEHRYQATFADGKVTLVRTGPGNWSPVSRPTPITRPGTYALRFANVDCRMRVWVNDAAVDFGGEADYPPTKAGDKPVDKNDLEAPAGVAARGTVAVSGLRLWRDTYYTPQRGNEDAVETYFVHPGHYLCLGDNSAQSSDGRTWGVVPERLMIGRAVFTFFPVHRIGVIR